MHQAPMNSGTFNAAWCTISIHSKQCWIPIIQSNTYLWAIPSRYENTVPEYAILGASKYNAAIGKALSGYLIHDNETEDEAVNKLVEGFN